MCSYRRDGIVQGMFFFLQIERGLCPTCLYLSAAGTDHLINFSREINAYGTNLH